MDDTAQRITNAPPRYGGILDGRNEQRMSNTWPKPIETPDQNKITLLRNALARVEAGEQFTGMAVIMADSKGLETPYDGKLFEILTGAVRLAHRMNALMDQDTD